MSDLIECQALAMQIADAAARTDIECHCVQMSMGNATWYDTATFPDDDDTDACDYVATAVRYLRLRGLILVHPTQPALVRFPR